jgi:ubiquinone/menaquinone biosynthesis C-methylase UbiE
MADDKRDFDKEAASWDENPERVKLAQEIADAMSNDITLAPVMDVLDFGCGTGLLTLRLQPYVRSIIGVDSSQGMLDVLNSKVLKQNLTNVKTLCLDLDRGDDLPGRYDLVVSSMTLHHIKDTKPILNLFHDIITPSGYLCIADLDPDDGQFHSDNRGVFHFGFDREELRREFSEAGFADVRDRSAGGVMKFIVGEGLQMFTVFLMTGRK